jgi:hypothetical protein
MRKMFLFLFNILSAFVAYSQEFRLGYDGKTLPELYQRTNIFVEERKGNEFIIISPKRYRLTTTEARLNGNTLTYDRDKVYEDSGRINFMLIVDGKRVPLTLDMPVLQDIAFNMYTDSIKPILNYYVNVEGKFSNGRTFPLDTSFVVITSDQGIMKGFEWQVPKQRDFEKVTFTAHTKLPPFIQTSNTLYLKKYQDPRDALDYQDRTEEEIIRGGRNRR